MWAEGREGRRRGGGACVSGGGDACDERWRGGEVDVGVETRYREMQQERMMRLVTWVDMLVERGRDEMDR